MHRTTVVIAAVCIAAAAHAGAGDEHLLAGARAFRDGKFQEAYVEFSVASRLGAGDDARWYVAAALVKLKRPEEALEAFSAAELAAPAARDPLLDYYRAMACYDARLYLCAQRLLSRVAAEGGPRMAAQSAQVVAAIRKLLERPPSTLALDWYLARGGAALAAGKGPLAAAYFEEAAGLTTLRGDGYRLPDATAGLAAARKERRSGGKP